MLSSLAQPDTVANAPFSLPHPAPQRSSSGNGKLVLVVEDDEILSRFLARLLRAEGYEVTLATTGQDALASVPANFDLVVLDLNLPDVDGLTVLARLRSDRGCPPVLVLTGRSRSECAVPALEAGADDCLTKPFSYVELLARLRVLLRRQTERLPGNTAPGGLSLQREQMCALRSGRRIDLTPREFALLECLMRTPGVPVSRTVLLDAVWGEGRTANSNVVDVYMKYVRDKVDLSGQTKIVHTVRGVGYVLREE